MRSLMLVAMLAASPALAPASPLDGAYAAWWLPAHPDAGRGAHAATARHSPGTARPAADPAPRLSTDTDAGTPTQTWGR